VDVTTEAVPGGKFAGHVVAISPAVDPATGVGLVRILVPNSSGLLRLGIFLTADVPVETHTRALVVPPEAIYRDEAGRPRVFVVNGDLATAVPVELGIETKEGIELLSGVQEGQTVILTGGYGLGDKANIRVRSQAQP
jgi:membrane fusion protein (multidrug efflux system)